jgi:DNA modification methylase
LLGKRETLHGDNQQWPAGSIARVTDHVVAHVGSVAANVDHPAMFPQPLADQLVKTYSPVGGLVADCFMGSGTTLLAARDAGRNWWGCDLVQKYVDLARRRLNS